MDDKKAVNILISLLEKYPFSLKEKEALKEAIGILSWSSLAQSRITAKKTKQVKDASW